MSIHLSTASNLLDKLDAARFIARSRSDKDQRVVRIRLTARGRRVVEMAPMPARGVVPDALHQIALQPLVELNKRLDDLIGHMRMVESKAVSKHLSEI